MSRLASDNVQHIWFSLFLGGPGVLQMEQAGEAPLTGVQSENMGTQGMVREWCSQNDCEVCLQGQEACILFAPHQCFVAVSCMWD